MAAADDRYGVVLNVQRGTKMRFECHVDSNPLTGLLFCTDHAGRRRARLRARPGRGGHRRGRAGLLGHPAARRAPDLLRRQAAPALRAAR